MPSRGAASYVSRHGFGYSVFEHTEDGIRSELWVYVAIDAPIKFSVLKVRNESGRSRRLSATGSAISRNTARVSSTIVRAVPLMRTQARTTKADTTRRSPAPDGRWCAESRSGCPSRSWSPSSA